MTAPSKIESVVMGGPIRDREWIAAEWFLGLLSQTAPGVEVIIAALVNDSRDDTLEICEWFENRFWNRVHVREQNFGCRVDNNDRGRRKRDYQQFANVRSAWIEWVREEWMPDAYFFVDSDIVLPPGILRQLARHRLPLVSAHIFNNHGCAPFHTNGMRWRDPENVPGDGVYWPYELAQSRKMEPVDVTGACFLIHREVIDRGIRYGYHEWGEDLDFCLKCREAGYVLWMDCAARADHRMKPVERHFLRDSASAGVLSDFWGWRGQRARLEGDDYEIPDTGPGGIEIPGDYSESAERCTAHFHAGAASLR